MMTSLIPALTRSQWLALAQLPEQEKERVSQAFLASEADSFTALIDAANVEVDVPRHNNPVASEGSRFVCPADPEWPFDNATVSAAGLDLVFGLWVRGDDPLPAVQSVLAVTGSAAATDYGMVNASVWTQDFLAAGFVPASCGSFGIDAAVARAATAQKSATLVWQAGGLDCAHPTKHVPVFDDVVACGGWIVSESRPGQRTTRRRSLRMRKLLAMSAHASVIIECGMRGRGFDVTGTSKLLGRSSWAMPGPVGAAASIGCHLMISDGQAEIALSTEQIVRTLARPPAAPVTP